MALIDKKKIFFHDAEDIINIAIASSDPLKTLGGLSASDLEAIQKCLKLYEDYKDILIREEERQEQILKGINEIKAELAALKKEKKTSVKKETLLNED